MNKEQLTALKDCTIFSTVKQEDDEAGWLAARTRGIGGSDIGAICGVSPFSTARQIYMKKTGQFEDGLKADNGSSQRMHFGHLLEPVVADEYARRTGRKLIEADATFKSNTVPFALANVDRLMVDDNGIPYGILECKTTSEYNDDEWADGDILMSYQYQLQWYLFVTGLELGAFACLVGGNKFYSYEVVRDDELINNVLVPAALNFWNNNVKKLVEPELQSGDSDLIASLFTEVKPNSEIVLDDDISDQLSDTVVKCKQQIKELKATMEEAQNRLKERIGNNEYGYTRNYTVKWATQSQRRVDSAILKAQFPEAYEKSLKTITFRKMTIKGVPE